MATLELNVLEIPNRVRFNGVALSIERFYELRGAGIGAIDSDIIATAQGLGFPDFGDTSDVRGTVTFRGNPQPCYDLGLVTLLGADADGGTQGAILYARFGFSPSGGTVVGNQASGTSTVQERFEQPYFHTDSAGHLRADKPTTRTRTTLVYSGIVGGQYNAEVVQGEIERFSGQVVLLRFAQLSGPAVDIFHVFQGARLIERPGSSLRYAAVFYTTGQLPGIPNNTLGLGVGCPDLNHLETYWVNAPRDGTAPFVVPRPVLIDGSNGGQYFEVPQDGLLWIQGLPRP